MAVTLTSPINTFTPPAPTEIAAGDVNGDGRTDLVTLTHGNSTNGFQEQAVVLLGDGQGSFQVSQTFAVGGPTITTTIPFTQYGGWEVSGIALGDVNGDGRLDIIRSEGGFIPQGEWGRVVVSLGNGNGTFQAGQEFATSGPSEAVTVGDVNADGKLDIITTNGLKFNGSGRSLENMGSISVLVGNGDGTFQGARQILPGHPVTNVTLANLDFDEHLDMVTTWWASTSAGSPAVVDLWSGDGAGGFNLMRSIPLAGRPDAVAVAFLGTGTTSPDFWPDILVATSAGLAVLNAPGGLIHDVPQYYATQNSGSFTFGLIGTESLSVADLDGDGKLDVVAGGGGAQTYYLLGNGNGTFQAAQGLGDTSRAATFAKINADGWFDFVTTNRDSGTGNGSISVLLSDTLPPELHSIVANTASTKAGAITETVTFSEAVTGVDAADFIVTTVNGTATGQIGSITGSGATYTVTINGITGVGGLRLDLKPADTGIVDLASRPLIGSLPIPRSFPNGTVTEILFNATPAATAATLATNEDTFLSGNMAGTDAESDSLTFAIVPNSATNGVVIPRDAATGEFWFIPDENFSGTASFQFTASDGNANGTSAPQTVTINVASVEDVLPLNSPPPPGGFNVSTIATTPQYQGFDTFVINNGLWPLFGTTAINWTVGAGATLGGSATLGDIRVLFAGILAPGNSPGTLAMGDVSFEAGAKFGAEIAGTGDGEYDRLNVTGTVTLGGATLEASVINGFDPETATGATFTLIDNDGTDEVSGTFANLAEGAVFAISGHNFSITYRGGTDNNDVVLTAVNDAPTLDAIANPAAIDEDAGVQTIDLAGITAGGGEAQPLQVTATSSNPLLIADPTVTYTSADAAGTLTFAPVANASGSAEITVTVTDGGADDNLATTGDNASIQRQFTVQVNAVNDPPQSGAVVLTAIAEDSGARVITQAELLAGVSDPDGPPAVARDLAIASGLGTLIDNGNGTWTCTPAANDTTAVSFSYVIDDGNAVAASASLDITPVNDAPAVTGPVTLAAIDEDSGARLITQAELTANASDIDGPSSPVAVNLQISAGLGSLANNGNGTWSYTPAANDDTSVTFSYQVTDGTAPVATSARLTINPVSDAPPIDTGTPGDDSFTAPSGARQFDGQGGIDTMIFGFELTDATVTYDGNKAIIDGPSSQTILTGFERFVFTDGTADNNDGNWLVDDLFYYSRNHDVWNTQADADQHYDQFGWHEGRDPGAFFSTAIYLSANPDVNVAGVNPLTHFDQSGWKEGRAPSAAFDPAAYLAANADVKAANVDPLLHFLQFGAGESRQPFALTELLATNGFDYVYYLQNNADVAAAGIDPLAHFQQFGWKEGRNPNALFDTAAYLATYGDVKAAGANPLDHYHAFGWKEGRDPSAGFDSSAYLAANADVQAANIDPLAHFLIFGRHEGRSAFADGEWG